MNYTSDSSNAVFAGFSYTGDFVYTTILEDFEALLNDGVRIAMYHGDAGELYSSSDPSFPPPLQLLHTIYDIPPSNHLIISCYLFITT